MCEHSYLPLTYLRATSADTHNKSPHKQLQTECLWGLAVAKPASLAASLEHYPVLT